MTRRYGIDTPVLVRWVTGHPGPSFEYSRTTLRRLIEEDGAEIFASNQVIGDAYIAIQHHYGLSDLHFSPKMVFAASRTASPRKGTYRRPVLAVRSLQESLSLLATLMSLSGDPGSLMPH